MVCKNGSSVGICTYTLHARLCTSRDGFVCCSRWLLTQKFCVGAQSEVYCKSALLVGYPFRWNFLESPFPVTVLPSWIVSERRDETHLGMIDDDESSSWSPVPLLQPPPPFRCHRDNFPTVGLTGAKRKMKKERGFLLSHLSPTTNGGMQNGSSVGIRTHCKHVFFCKFGANLHAGWMLTNKISALEISRKIIKGALLVGFPPPPPPHTHTHTIYPCPTLAARGARCVMFFATTVLRSRSIPMMRLFAIIPAVEEECVFFCVCETQTSSCWNPTVVTWSGSLKTKL